MKIIVEIEKKVGLSNYGSTTAKVGIHIDRPDALAEDHEALHAELTTLQDLARNLVDHDLERQTAYHATEHAPASAAERPTRSAPAPVQSPTHVNGKAFDGPPQTGRALFKWAKDQETTYEVGLIRYLNQWAKLQGFPFQMSEWRHDQVVAGHAEASRKLALMVAEGVST